MNIFTTVCPSCQCRELKPHTLYKTVNQLRTLLFPDCQYFSGRAQIDLSLVVLVIKARAEGMEFNAACRTLGLAKNTLINWESRFPGIKQTLQLCILLHRYLQLIIEGDGDYTEAGKMHRPKTLSAECSSHGQSQPFPLGIQVQQKKSQVC